MAFTLHFHAPLLILAVAAACSPKLDGDDTGDETGITTTGDEVTTSGSASGSGQSTDPTMPGATATASTTTGDGTATTATTTSGNPTVATTGDDSTSAGTSATSTGTSATSVGSETATATDTGEPVDPPQPCGGEATPQVGITTTMAYLKSQVPPVPDPTVGSTSTGGREQDPGTLFLHFSDQAYTCADPAANLLCGPHWSLTIVIPPEFQSPGLHNLAGQNVFAFGSETGVDQGMNECEFGGGTQGGTFEIFAIDDQTVEGRLCNLGGIFPWTAQLEGSFSAARCP